MSDLRYALRTLAKSPRFTSVAILSLALGIGANTAVYSAIRVVLFDTLPVRAAEELVELGWTRGGTGRTGVTTMGSTGFAERRGGKSFRTNFSYSLYRAFQQTSTDSADVFGFSFVGRDVSVSLGHQAIVGSSLLVSGNFFSVLGVPAVRGRPLSELDDRAGAPPVAVITHRFWMRAFGGDPDALGRSVLLNGAPFTIVGVTTPAFFGMSKGGFFPPTDVILPLAAQPLVYTRAAPAERSLFAAEDRWWVRVMARVRPGALGRVEAEMNGTFRGSLAASLLPGVRDTEGWELALFPAARGVDALTSGMRQPLYVLGGVVTIVLLIACVNVGNLMLARGVARQKEMAIRLALGSTRWQLARGIAIESLVIAIAGGALGTLVGMWGGRALLTMLAGAGRTALDVPLDGRLLAATAAVSGLAALLFGLAPALRTRRHQVAPAMKQGSGGWNTPRLGAGRILMVAQVAISVPLLAGSVLLLRTVYNLAHVDLGFNPDRLMIFSVDPSLNGYEPGRIAQFYARLLQRLDTIPGVTSATLTDIVLLSRVQNNWRFRFEGSEEKNLKFTRVGSGYFATIGIPIVAGRAIGAQDHERAPRVAVVNESASQALFGPGPAIGRRFSMEVEPPVDYEVVGVAKDSRYTSPRDPMPPTIYLPREQTMAGPFGSMNVVVRTAVPAASLAGPIRAAVAEVDRNVPVTGMKTQSEQIDQTLGTERAFMRLLIVFGAFALVLASIGVHGLAAYSVARRTSEIGVRVALGAQHADVLWLILRQTAAITVVGLALGIPAAIAATRLMRATLYGVEPGDPLSLAAAAGLMATVATAAGFFPAHRAARLDPLVALRHD
jgi:predicted permease